MFQVARPSRTVFVPCGPCRLPPPLGGFFFPPCFSQVHLIPGFSVYTFPPEADPWLFCLRRSFFTPFKGFPRTCSLFSPHGGFSLLPTFFLGMPLFFIRGLCRDCGDECGSSIRSFFPPLTGPFSLTHPPPFDGWSLDFFFFSLSGRVFRVTLSRHFCSNHLPFYQKLSPIPYLFAHFLLRAPFSLRTRSH